MLENKATRALHKILTNIKILYNTNLNVYSKLFGSLVEPILLYGSEVWGLSFISNRHLEMSNCIEDFWKMMVLKYNNYNKIHIKFCRYILQLSRNSSKLCTLLELGRFPLLVKQIVRATKFYIRISNIMNETWLLSAVELQKYPKKRHD